MPQPIKAYLGNVPLFDAGQSSAGYQRPEDWLPLPAAQPDSVKILNAVFDQFENFAAVRMITSTGDYQVDWGDGTVDIVASNAIASHNYDFNSTALDGTLTTRGYKQAIIVVTPVSGVFAYAFLNVRPATPSGLQSYGTGFLDANINLPNIPSNGILQLGAGSVRHPSLERVNITSWGATTNLVNLFANCTSLQSVNETEWNLSNITTIQNIFQNANSIKSLNCRNWNLSKCNNAISAFSGCSALAEIQLPTTGFAVNANLSGMFANCNSIISIDLSMLDVSNVTNMASMFNRSSSLREINFTGWNTSSVTDVNNMFFNCYALQKIPALNFGAATNFTAFVGNCLSLVSMKATGINVSVNMSNCMLGATALNEIYTNLSNNGTGKTITVSGNYGTASDDPSIAIAKGWAVTG